MNILDNNVLVSKAHIRFFSALKTLLQRTAFVHHPQTIAFKHQPSSYVSFHVLALKSRHIRTTATVMPALA